VEVGGKNSLKVEELDRAPLGELIAHYRRKKATSGDRKHPQIG